MADYSFYEDFKALLSNRLQELDMTTKEVADMTGISNQTIKNFLGGKTKMMKYETQQPIVSVLNLDNDYMNLLKKHFPELKDYDRLVVV